MTNAQTYINLYNSNQANRNEATLSKMEELELLLTESEVDQIESVLGEFCFH